MDLATTSLPPFVDAEWLAANLDEVLLADVRASMDGSEGEHTYLQAHLPGAVFVDLDAVLASAPSAQGGRHPLPTPERFAGDLGQLGIGDDRVVIAYDQGPGAWAARLAWSLRVIGQPAAVLDGGMARWDGPTASGAVVRPAAQRRVVPWPADRLIDTDELGRRHLDVEVVVLDARDAGRYAGEVASIDPRDGHIPGARSAPFSENLVEGRLRPLDALRRRYDALDAGGAKQVIAYCGSGVTACHDLLVLEALGVHGRLYPGSWSAWSADPSRPIATGRDLDAGSQRG